MIPDYQNVWGKIIDENTVADTLKWRRDMATTLDILKSDFSRASLEWRKSNNDQFLARNVIRCAFAYIEAVLWHLRQLTVRLGPLVNLVFSPQELEELTEERIAADGKRKTKWLKFPESVKVS